MYGAQRMESSRIRSRMDKSLTHRSKNQSHFELELEEGSNIDLEQDEPELVNNLRNNEMFNSQLLLQNNYTIDDIEKQRFRTNK